MHTAISDQSERKEDLMSNPLPDEEQKPNALAQALFDEIKRGEMMTTDGTRPNRHSRRREEALTVKREGA